MPTHALEVRVKVRLEPLEKMCRRVRLAARVINLLCRLLRVGGTLQIEIS